MRENCYKAVLGYEFFFCKTLFSVPLISLLMFWRCFTITARGIITAAMIRG